MEPPFCLLDLPKESIKTILQYSNIYDLISFSLCSEKMLAFVRDLNLDIFGFHLKSRDNFGARLRFRGETIELYFCEDGHGRQNVDNIDRHSRKLKVDYIEATEQSQWCHAEGILPVAVTRQWRKANFSGKDWVCHFMKAFPCDKLRRSMSITTSKYEIDSLWETVKDFDFDKLSFYRDLPKPYIMKVLKAFHSVEDFYVASLSLDDSEHSVLLSNWRAYFIGSPLTLDQLLSTNSIEICTNHVLWDDLNRFIKLCVHGSNPRLQFVNVNYEGIRVIDENQILKGIRCKRIPEDTERTFVLYGYPAQIEIIKRGFDVVGSKGRKATVIINNNYYRSFFRMYVW